MYKRQLQSPYIVGVYDWGKDGDTYYIVMEYLRGTDLKSGVRSHGALDQMCIRDSTYDEAACIADALVQALSFAHENGVLHLDIKPANVLIDRNGHVKLADFGMATVSYTHLDVYKRQSP